MHWVQSYCSTWFYMESAKKHHEQIPCAPLHQQHQSWQHQHGALQPAVGPSPRPALLPKGGPWAVPIPEWLQDNAEAVSSLITWKLHLQGVLAFLLPVNLTPSCPPCQISPRSQLTTAEQLQVEFPHHFWWIEVLLPMSKHTVGQITLLNKKPQDDWFSAWTFKNCLKIREIRAGKKTPYATPPEQLGEGNHQQLPACSCRALHHLKMSCIFTKFKYNRD